MSELWLILFGIKGIRKSEPKFFIFIKLIYLTCILPFVLFAMGIAFKSRAGSSRERSGIVKKVLVHFSAISISFCLWGIIISAIQENLIK